MIFSKKDMPVVTTDNVIEDIKGKTPKNIVIRIQDSWYLISTDALTKLAMSAIPSMLTDQDNKQFAVIRSGIKGLLRPFLPDLLKKTYGEEVYIKPQLNVLEWLPAYLVTWLVGLIAQKGWSIGVENCEDCGDRIYQIVRITASGTDPNRETDKSTTVQD